MDMARIKRVFQTVLVAFFVLIIGIEFSGTVLSEKTTISLAEKRTLASLPDLQWSRESLEAYPESFEKFWQDHFLFRRQLVAMNSLLRLFLFHRAPTFVALSGDNNWYYMVGDWALQDYLGTIHMTPERLATWQHVIAQRRQWVRSWGGHYLLMIAPNKMRVYPEHLPFRLRHNRGTSMMDALNKYLADSPLSDNVLDVQDVLLQAKQERRVYYKTDTHWNSYGAYQAYRELIKKIQQWYPEVEPLPPDRLRVKIVSSSNGDLALLMGLVDLLEEKVEEWSVVAPCVADKNQAVPVLDFLRKDQYPEKIVCPRGAPLRVLVISDSFGSPLQQYLSQTFQEVVYDSSVEFNDFEEFIADYQPDIILHLHVARFMEKAFVVDPELDNRLSGDYKAKTHTIKSQAN